MIFSRVQDSTVFADASKTTRRWSKFVHVTLPDNPAATKKRIISSGAKALVLLNIIALVLFNIAG